MQWYWVTLRNILGAFQAGYVLMVIITGCIRFLNHIDTVDIYRNVRWSGSSIIYIVFSDIAHFSKLSLTLNLTIFVTNSNGIGLSIGNLRLPLGPSYGDTSFLNSLGAGG